MVAYNETAEALLKRIGKNTVVDWYEEESRIRFHCTYYDLVELLFDVNKDLNVTGAMITLEDIVDSIKKSTGNENSVIYPDDFEKNILAYGWNLECFSCWDYMFIDALYYVDWINNNPTFIFRFLIPYCEDCYNCDINGTCNSMQYISKVAN